MRGVSGGRFWSDDSGHGVRPRRMVRAIWLLGVAGVIAAFVGVGSPAVAQGGPDVITTPDRAGDVGRFTSMVLDASGNPVISYVAGFPNGDLKVMHCTNPNCSGNQSPATLDSAPGFGGGTALVLDAVGDPVISYEGVSNSVRVLHCTNPDCSGTQTPQTPVIGQVHPGSISLALDAAGNPVISYSDLSESGLWVLHCTNPNCSGSQTPQTPDAVRASVGSTSLALDSAGNPVISYHVYGDGLRVLHCSNPNCSGTQTPQTPHEFTLPGTIRSVGEFGSLVLDAAGRPVISYWGEPIGRLVVLHCTNVDCSGNQSPLIPNDSSAGIYGSYTSLALDAAGHPIISYYDETNGDLLLLHCTNTNRAGTQTRQTPDSAGNVGSHTSLVLDAAGNPVVSYYDSVNGDLKVLHCYDARGCAEGGEGGSIPAACAGFEGANIIRGTSRGDFLTGTPESDVIIGRGGNDTIRGLGGNDCLLGGGGADTIRGGRGDDVIRGGSGADNIRGQGGADNIRGQGGADTIRGNGGADIIFGGGKDDRLFGNGGRDVIRGGSGDDIISGGGKADRLFGGRGNDSINGGKGRDRCRGGPGTDTLTRCGR